MNLANSWRLFREYKFISVVSKEYTEIKQCD